LSVRLLTVRALTIRVLSYQSCDCQSGGKDIVEVMGTKLWVVWRCASVSVHMVGVLIYGLGFIFLFIYPWDYNWEENDRFLDSLNTTAKPGVYTYGWRYKYLSFWNLVSIIIFIIIFITIFSFLCYQLSNHEVIVERDTINLNFSCNDCLKYYLA